MYIYEKIKPTRDGVNPDDVSKNVQANLGVLNEGSVAESLTTQTLDSPNNENVPVAIVNPGPSARGDEAFTRLNSRRSLDDKDMIIVAANAGLMLLKPDMISHMDAFVLNLPQNEPLQLNLDQEFGTQNLTYHMASMVMPAAVRHLVNKGADVRMFHGYADGGEVLLDGGVNNVIGTGSGAPVAALLLYAAMGHRNFEFFGMDGSVRYAVDLKPGDDTDEYLRRLERTQIAVRISDHTFAVPKEFWVQTLEVIKFMKEYPESVQSINFTGENTVNTALFNSAQREMVSGVPQWNFPEYKILETQNNRRLDDFFDEPAVRAPAP